MGPVDWGRIVRAKDDIVARIARHDSPEAIERAGVRVLWGRARFRSLHEVEIDGRGVGARYFVVATGTRQADPTHIQGLKEAGYITHVEAVNLQSLPRSIAVLGGGPVGVEFAQLFARLGVEVTLLERGEPILPKEDPEISEYLERLLAREGIALKHYCSEKRVSRKGAKKLLSAELEGKLTRMEVD